MFTVLDVFAVNFVVSVVSVPMAPDVDVRLNVPASSVPVPVIVPEPLAFNVIVLVVGDPVPTLALTAIAPLLAFVVNDTLPLMAPLTVIP